MAVEMTQAAYARHRNVSQEAVRQAVANGRIPFFVRGSRKVIDRDVADAAWDRNTDVDQANRGNGNKKPERIDVGDTSWSAAKTRESVARAQMLELELQERAGELVSRAGVEKALQGKLIALAEHLQGIADRCAAVFAAQTDVDAIFRALTHEHQVALQMLSGAATGKH